MPIFANWLYLQRVVKPCVRRFVWYQGFGPTRQESKATAAGALEAESEDSPVRMRPVPSLQWVLRQKC